MPDLNILLDRSPLVRAAENESLAQLLRMAGDLGDDDADYGSFSDIDDLEVEGMEDWQ